jgi:serine/threonine protein kinase
MATGNKRIRRLLGGWVGAPIPGDLSQNIPSVDGSYRLIKILGEGGNAIVFEAEEVRVGHRKVALKVIDLRVDDEEDREYMAMVRRRLDDEIKVLGVLTDIPDTVTVFGAEVDVDRQVALISMQLLRGRSLQAYLYSDEGRRHVEPETFAWYCLRFAEAADTLARMHDHGVVHRDMKPSNIVVAEIPGQNPRSKLIDFGISLRLSADGAVDGARHTKSGEITGTPAYMAPEQHLNSNPRDLADVPVSRKPSEAPMMVFDGTVDLYALGVMIFEAFSGGYLPRIEHLGPDPRMPMIDLYRALVGGYAKRTGTGPHDFLEPDFDRFPIWLREHPGGKIVIDVLKRALEVNRKKRLQSCKELAAALYKAAELAVEGGQYGPGEPTRGYEFALSTATPPTPPPPALADASDPSGPPSLAGMTSKSGIRVSFLADPERRQIVLASMVGLGLAMAVIAVFVLYVKPQQATRDAATTPHPTPIASVDAGLADAPLSADAEPITDALVPPQQVEDAGAPAEIEPDAALPIPVQPPVVVQPSNPNRSNGQRVRGRCERLTDLTARRDCEAERAEDEGRRNCCRGRGLATWTSRAGEQYTCGDQMDPADRAELNCDSGNGHRRSEHKRH